MLIDTRIIHREGRFAVQAQQQLVDWPDHSRVTLHPVVAGSVDDTFLRALQLDELRWAVFDVRDVLDTAFEQDVRSLPRSDTDGLVFYGLRLGYRNAAHLRAKVEGLTRATWFVQAAEDPEAPSAFAYFGGRNQVAQVVRHAAA